MLTRSNRRVGLLAAAVVWGGLAAPWTVAQGNGQPAGPGVSPEVAPPTPGGAVIAEAARLADSGRLVEARALLNKVMVSEDLAPRLTDEERRQLAHVGRVVDGRMQSADPIEMSLQKGELAAAEGDLRLAERQATAVLGKAAASDAARDRAQAILAGVNQRRQEMAPLIDGMLDQVVRDFDSGKVLAAKNGLAAVTRSGVRLTPAQERTVDQYQVLVLQMEQTRGASLRAEAADLALGMLQPGTVRRGDQVQSPPPPPPPAPGAQQPPAEPPPAQPPAGEDVVRAALIANAQKVLAEADMAFQEKRYEEARTKYHLSATTHATYLTADQIAHASRRLAEIQAIIGQPGGGLGEQVVRDISLQRQRATAEFENQLAQAERALAAGDTGRARELAAGARLTANSNAPVFGENENQEMQRKVADLFRRIDAETERRAQVEAQERERALIEQQKRSEITSRVDKERKINEAIDRIRALQQELKYEEALQVVDQVLFLDPINPAGLLLRDTLQDIVVYRKYHDLQRLKRSNSVLQRLDAEADMVPPRGIIDYPPDWPAKTFQRGEMSAYTESPEDRRVLSELNSRKVPVDFADNALGDVIDFIAQVTSVNIDPDWDSLASIGITRDTPVSLRLSQVPMRVVLDRVLQKASERAGGLQRANWAVNDGILMIASDEQLRKQTTLVIYNITDLLLEIPNFYDAPSLDLQSVLQQSAGTAAGGRATSPFRDGQAQQAGRDEMERRKRDRITQITQIIEQNVDFNGWRNNGGDTGMIQELNGSLIITNTPRNHREITGLLSKLREIRSMQINVETKFLLVNQDWFEAIGFDLDVVINANNNQVRAARANDPTIQAGDFFNFNPSQNGGNFMARRVVGQGTPAGVAPPGGLDATRVAQGVVNPRAWSPVGVGQGHLPLANSLVVGDFATGVSALAPALGIAGQFLDDVQVDFLILATQADRRTVQLTAPRLTFTNGQTSNIFVVTQQAFVSDLEPVVGDSAVGFDPTVAVVSEGVVMTVEGVISADRRYVTLNVDAGVSRIDGFATQAVTAVAGGQLVSSADTQSFIQLPTITVTRVRTTVTVPDEGTVLLGGQRLVTELEIETGVPVLSKIPIINRFFTTRLESKSEQTLLILIKPTVLIQTEEEEKNFPGLSDRVQSGGLGL